MKKTKIGIPRALLYHRYGVMWKHFFIKLGCKIILSPETNQEIVKLGNNNTIDECCLTYKIYIGHILSLQNCDYILVSRICNYGRKNKVCTRFNGTYDNIKNLISKKQILEYNIDYKKLQYPLLSYIKMGFKITKNPIKIIYSYLYAKAKQKKYNINQINNTKSNLLKPNKKILILSHFYNIKDKYISNYIIDYLKQKNLIPIFSDQIDKKTALLFSQYFSNTLYWKYSKEIVGSFYYFKNQIDGIIFISTYPCGIDSLVNNLLILKNKNIPKLNLIIDENTTNLNLETKLESFLDIIKGDNYE